MIGQLDGPGNTSRGFRWSADGSVSILDLGPNYPFTTTTQINDKGQIVGSGTNQTGGSAAFLWKGDSLTFLRAPAGGRSGARDVNNQGQIVGFTDVNYQDLRAVIWENGKATGVGSLGGYFTDGASINDRGDVIGTAETPQGDNHAFLAQNGQIFDLGTLAPSDTSGMRSTSYPRDINNKGQVVGYSDAGDGQRAVLWQDRVLIELEGLGGNVSEAIDINERWQIVGFSTDAAGMKHAVMWTVGRCQR